MDIRAIQDSLRRQSLDGWLFYDHHHRDQIAYGVLGLPLVSKVTRRWYYFVPAVGEPRALMNKLEPHQLETLPGKHELYSSWPEQHALLRDLLKGAGKIAMQHSPLCAIPYVANVDSGTIELVRSFGHEVVSSAVLVQEFEARLSDEAIESHFAAGRKIDQLRRDACAYISERVGSRQRISEYDVKRFILDEYAKRGLTTEFGPDIMVNENASDPHYEPTAEKAKQINSGDLVVIDMWGKLKTLGAIYYDITWCCFCGKSVPQKIQEIFDIVVGARDVGIEKVVSAVKSGTPLLGCDLDDHVRRYISERGYGQYFFHRTGHSIGQEIHSNGANIDNFESHDERPLMKRSCFSIEPGIYLPEFGIRSEVDVLIDDKEARVTGEIQREIVLL